MVNLLYLIRFGSQNLGLFLSFCNVNFGLSLAYVKSVTHHAYLYLQTPGLALASGAPQKPANAWL